MPEPALLSCHQLSLWPSQGHPVITPSHVVPDSWPQDGMGGWLKLEEATSQAVWKGNETGHAPEWGDAQGLCLTRG